MVIVVPVMFRFACSLLCYVVLYSVIMFYLLVFPFICLCLLVVQVGVGDGHASQYAMLSGYDLLLIWWIVMWYPHDDVDIMFMHCNWYHVILSWLRIFAFKFNRIKLNLNNYWLSHGATISKLTSATTLTFMGRSKLGLLSCLLLVPPIREGYGRTLPWSGRRT